MVKDEKTDLDNNEWYLVVSPFWQEMSINLDRKFS